MGMQDKTTKQVREAMDKTFAEIKVDLPEAELIDSIVADKAPKDGTALWYLGEGFKRMSKAKMVFFIDDYKNYRGCNAEKAVAEAYGKMCVEFKTKK